ncbi:MAG: hypothetical protein K0U76_05140 [Actinomycetia bacterium]|nr:hypothetical protein [Actinomycetes bacterium]MCH9700760.1 hypothetical protein [Actinomycetes bacterium]MCH9760909.1 hypothetical protein [Actinomycetes bacterium]
MPRSLHVVLAAAAVTTSLLAAGSAAAEPPPPPLPPDPLLVAPQPPPAPAPTGTNLLGVVSDLATSVPTETVPGLMVDPASAMQGIGLGSPSPVNPLAGVDLLMATGFRMPSDDVPSPYALESGVPAGPFARLSALNGVQAMLRGTLGRMPGAELGEALPGTAPPPDIRTPPGLEQFYIDPNLPPPPPGG